MFNKQLKRNIQALDAKIGKLYEDYDKVTTDGERKLIMDQAKELADLRDKLSESKTRESLIPILIPGAVGLAAMFMVIRHENVNIITTKAMGIATKFIRGH